MSQPAANALIPFSPSMMYAAGTRTPDAIAISSTMLRNRRSSGSRVSGETRRAPAIFATASPPSVRRSTFTVLTVRMSAAVTAAPHR